MHRKSTCNISNLLGLTLLAVLLVGTVSCAHIDNTSEQAATPTLYDRLGGVYSIATVVDDFLERLLVNDTLNANPAVEAARHRVAKAGLKYQITALVCEVTGGPERYAGRSMKDSHVHLNITEGEWAAMAGDFKKTLDKFKVPEKEQSELFAIVGTTKADIVTTGE